MTPASARVNRLRVGGSSSLHRVARARVLHLTYLLLLLGLQPAAPGPARAAGVSQGRVEVSAGEATSGGPRAQSLADPLSPVAPKWVVTRTLGRVDHPLSKDPAVRFWDLTVDGEGTVYVRQADGIVVFGRDGTRRVPFPAALPVNGHGLRILSAFVAIGPGQVLTEHGVCDIKTGKFTPLSLEYHRPDGVVSDYVFDAALHPSGSIYFLRALTWQEGGAPKVALGVEKYSPSGHRQMGWRILDHTEETDKNKGLCTIFAFNRGSCDIACARDGLVYVVLHGEVREVGDTNYDYFLGPFRLIRLDPKKDETRETDDWVPEPTLPVCGAPFDGPGISIMRGGGTKLEVLDGDLRTLATHWLEGLPVVEVPMAMAWGPGDTLYVLLHSGELKALSVSGRALSGAVDLHNRLVRLLYPQYYQKDPEDIRWWWDESGNINRISIPQSHYGTMLALERLEEDLDREQPDSEALASALVLAKRISRDTRDAYNALVQVLEDSQRAHQSRYIVEAALNQKTARSEQIVADLQELRAQLEKLLAPYTAGHELKKLFAPYMPGRQ